LLFPLPQSWNLPKQVLFLSFLSFFLFSIRIDELFHILLDFFSDWIFPFSFLFVTFSFFLSFPVPSNETIFCVTNLRETFLLLLWGQTKLKDKLSGGFDLDLDYYFPLPSPPLPPPTCLLSSAPMTHSRWIASKMSQS
jgi:hypothetical protein